MENNSNPQPKEVKKEKREFRKELGLFSGVNVVGGVMIGSGIFYLGSYVMERTDYNIGAAILCWVLGGVISLLGGICFAELGGMMPKAGGLTTYLTDVYHPVVGYMYGFSQWLLASPGSVAAIAIAIPTAFIDFFPGMSDMSVKIIAILLVIGFTVYNIIGVKEVAVMANITMIAKLLPMFVIIIGALFLGSEMPDLNPVPLDANGNMISAGSFIGMIAFATLATLWAYEGWSNVANIAEEIKNPKRNLPWALILGIGGVTIIYVLFNFGIYRVIPGDEAQAMIEAGNVYLGTEVAERLFGNAGSILVLAGMVVAMVGALNAFILVFSRIAYAMAKEGHFFRNHAVLSKKGIPVGALLSQCAISIALICFQSLDQLTTLVVFLGMIGSVLGVFGVIVARKKFPNMERPYKVWGYPVTVIISTLLFVGLMVNNFIEEPFMSILGLIIVPAIGFVIYYYYERKNKREGWVKIEEPEDQ